MAAKAGLVALKASMAAEVVQAAMVVGVSARRMCAAPTRTGLRP